MFLILKKLLEKNIISKEKAAKILNFEENKPVSVFYELQILLYTGITSLCTGLGILIYQNVNTFGHSILIFLLIVLCSFCCVYAFRHKNAFTWFKPNIQSVFLDYSILGGCLLFLIIETYLQYQYNIFGKSLGLATVLPAILFLFVAYNFDHLGVLSMGIVTFGSWLGITVLPKNIFETFSFINKNLIVSSILYGVLLVAVGWYSDIANKKKHFSFNYYFIGGNIGFIATLTGIFNLDLKFIYFIILLIFSGLSFLNARNTKSYLVLIMSVIYVYIGVSYFIFYSLENQIQDAGFYFFYFIISCVGIVVFLLNIKKILGIQTEAKS